MTWCFLIIVLLTVSDAAIGQQLPDATQLRGRALANMQKSAKALERYSCSVLTQSERLNGKGEVLKTESERSERFFVNGIQIDHLLEKNGKALDGKTQEKEQRRSDDLVKKYSQARQAQKIRDEREKRLEMFLRAQRFVNGERQMRAGRKTLKYDMDVDPGFRPRNLEERFAQAAGGRIWLDEESGAPAELNLHTVRDVKIGAGLLANLHKGFQLHVVSERQPDGVWLTKLAEGNADLRAGLFFHPRIRFREAISNCRLYSVESKDVAHPTSHDKQ
jgi:hypothetical protein